MHIIENYSGQIALTVIKPYHFLYISNHMSQE